MKKTIVTAFIIALVFNLTAKTYVPVLAKSEYSGMSSVAAER